MRAGNAQGQHGFAVAVAVILPVGDIAAHTGNGAKQVAQRGVVILGFHADFGSQNHLAAVVWHGDAAAAAATAASNAATAAAAAQTTADNAATAAANAAQAAADVADDLSDFETEVASTYATKAEIASVYKYKGSVATFADLPSSGQTTGDVYNVEADGMNYAWNGTAWDAL